MKNKLFEIIDFILSNIFDITVYYCIFLVFIVAMGLLALYPKQSLPLLGLAFIYNLAVKIIGKKED